MYNLLSVETIVPKEERKPQETLVLKSDGTTQKLVHKSKLARTSVNQEKQSMREKEEKVEKQAKTGNIERVEKEEEMEKHKEPEKKEDSDKPRLGRALTSQEESILLPLLQGLLTANGTDVSMMKQEDSSSQEKEQRTSNKNSRSEPPAERNEQSKCIIPMYFTIRDFTYFIFILFIDDVIQLKVNWQKDRIYLMNYRQH